MFLLLYLGIESELRITNRTYYTQQVIHFLVNSYTLLFSGWFEYNLHQQAVNRKLKKYIFEEEGLFNDLVSFQANNATLRAGKITYQPNSVGGIQEGLPYTWSV